MEELQVDISGKKVIHYYADGMEDLQFIINGRQVFFITDTNVAGIYASFFKDKKTIEIKAGEEYKTLATVELIIKDLLEKGADKSSLLIGVGGGVVTDITGFVASIFMRGISFGFVPTTLLAQVDASIGGKNGVDHGQLKNMVGCINQPQFIYFTPHFLQSLPEVEWSNGFAEIIKYGVIGDAALFDNLKKNDLETFRNDPKKIKAVIHLCVEQKTKFVQVDEHDKKERRLLNFGHTIGHAIENTAGISHGQAVAVGMVAEALLSAELLNFPTELVEELKEVIRSYKLPVNLTIKSKEFFPLINADKKKSGNEVDMILLKNIGQATIHKMEMQELAKFLETIE